MQRKLELGRRAVLLFALVPAGVGASAPPACRVAKILENMEIGHNVMHGQWDWMRDPKIHSTTWEWDNASPAEQWKHTHNEMHHTFTNVRRQGQRPRLRHHARRRGPALAPVLPRPADVELHQRLLLRVRHRGLRPRARREPRQEARRPKSPEFRRPARSRCSPRSAARRPRTTSSTRCCRRHRLVPARRSRRTSPPTSCATCGRTRSSSAATSPRASQTFEKTLDRGRDPRRVVRAPDARLGQHQRLQGHAHR